MALREQARERKAQAAALLDTPSWASRAGKRLWGVGCGKKTLNIRSIIKPGRLTENNILASYCILLRPKTQVQAGFAPQRLVFVIDAYVRASE